MKKIAFIKIGSFSGKNIFVFDFLKKYFPECQVEVIDVWEDLIPYKTWGHLFHALREYGLKVLWKNYATAVLRTGFFRDRVRTALKDRLEGQDWLFTFQTGSFFDGSMPGIPHFVYLDASQISIFKQIRLSGRSLIRSFSQELFHHRTGWSERIRKEIAESIQAKFVQTPSKMAREKNVFEHAARVFTMSEYDRAVLIQDYEAAAEKILCVYSGPHVEPDPAQGAPPYEKKKILFIGSEWERKGGPELLGAFRHIHARHPQATLTVVGCSPRLKDHGCIVLGRLTKEEVRQQYQQASIFCVPTRVEAFGFVFVEAQYFRLPVLATSTGALPEIVQDEQTGYLVPPGDIQALTGVLGDLLGNPQRCRDFGQNGAALVREQYNWDKTSDRMLRSMRDFLK